MVGHPDDFGLGDRFGGNTILSGSECADFGKGNAGTSPFERARNDVAAAGTQSFLPSGLSSTAIVPDPLANFSTASLVENFPSVEAVAANFGLIPPPTQSVVSGGGLAPNDGTSLFTANDALGPASQTGATLFGTPIFPPNGGFAPSDDFSLGALAAFAEAGRKRRAMEAAALTPVAPIASVAPVVPVRPVAPGTAATPGGLVPVAQAASAAQQAIAQQTNAFVTGLAQQIISRNKAAKRSPMPPLPPAKTQEEIKVEAAPVETQIQPLTGNTEVQGQAGSPRGEGGASLKKTAPASEAAVRGEIDGKNQVTQRISFGRDLGSSKDRLGWTIATLDELKQKILKNPVLLDQIGKADEVRIGANIFTGSVAQLMLLSLTSRPEERKAIRAIIGKTNSIHGEQRARILDILDPTNDPQRFDSDGAGGSRQHIVVLQKWLDRDKFQAFLDNKRGGAGALAFGMMGSAVRGRGAGGQARRLQRASAVARRNPGPAAAKQAAASLATAQRLTRRLIAKRKLALGEAERGSGVLPRPKHTANIIVRGKKGNVRIRTRFVSGNMTAEEKMLPFRQRTLATHTEVRAINAVKLKPGETMEITGIQRPCNSCKGHMNSAARKRRVRIIYRWRENGRTEVWVTDGR